jgi:hypothetical protein
LPTYVKGIVEKSNMSGHLFFRSLLVSCFGKTLKKDYSNQVGLRFWGLFFEGEGCEVALKLSASPRGFGFVSYDSFACFPSVPFRHVFCVGPEIGPRLKVLIIKLQVQGVGLEVDEDQDGGNGSGELAKTPLQGFQPP